LLNPLIYRCLSFGTIKFFTTILIWASLTTTANAHGGEGLTDATAWGRWNLTPEVVILTLITLVIYLRGMKRLKALSQSQGRIRAALFLSGLGAVFLALQSPIDPIAERLFSIHQVQHLLLRMVGPMLLALSAPEGTMIAGLPRRWRRNTFRYLGTNRWLSVVYRILRNPVFVVIAFIASLYIWQVPSIHNSALLNSALHYFMHVTMLAAGLLFWWMIFDHREAATAVSHPLRLIMLIGMIVLNILLGAVTTLKEVVLYTAYDIEGRLFDMAPLVDEVIGGYLIWVPSSMMCLISIIIVIHGWAKREERRYSRRHSWLSSNSIALEFPETAEELWIKVQKTNRATAMVLAAMSTAMLVLALGTALSVAFLT
jgi:putative membrane protein